MSDSKVDFVTKNITPERALMWALGTNPNFAEEMKNDTRNKQVMVILFETIDAIIRCINGNFTEKDKKLLSVYYSKEHPMIKELSHTFPSFARQFEPNHMYIVIGCGKYINGNLGFEFFSCTVVDINKV